MKPHGFSLLEFLVALAVAAILLALCLPGYRAQGEQMHRLAAEAKLLAWQAGGVRPSDSYYVYRKTVSGGASCWQASAVNSQSVCHELSLVGAQHLPQGCWSS
jgi:prepilin-type N-terminal cleavage/methylation domain-containing protein